MVLCMRKAEKTLGERIRSVRERLELTHRALADRAGLTHGWVFQVEAGIIKNPHYETIAACAKALGVRVGWLMTGKGDEASPTEAA
jgi:transcriptional regulator with XRE-family HTH domain